MINDVCFAVVVNNPQYSITYDANADLKFANGSWDVNWGATAFPLGYGTNGGPNIPVKAGAYRVYFNDCLGLYYFQATE